MKTGDIVECVVGEGSLLMGGTYTVTRTCGDLIYVNGNGLKDHGGWPKSLFNIKWLGKDFCAKPSKAESAGFVCPTIPIETLRMLEETSMLDLHDDNGPGRVECPVCGAGIPMRWKWGKRLDSPDEIKHNDFCPVAWANRNRS